MRILSDKLLHALQSIRASLTPSTAHFQKVLLHASDVQVILDEVPAREKDAVRRDKPVIYLCGPMAGTSDLEMTGWREMVKERLSPYYDFRDPCRRDYRENHIEDAAPIVEGDIEDITYADILLANCWQRSYGTIMEIPYAKLLGKLVVVALPDQFVSPWVTYHSSDVYKTIEEAVDTLEKFGAMRATARNYGNYEGAV